MPFKSGVYGEAWAIEGSDYHTINVRLSNGVILQFLHASTTFMPYGEKNRTPVTPDTVLGLTGSTGADAIHLHVQARDPAGRYLDPDCATSRLMKNPFPES